MHIRSVDDSGSDLRNLECRTFEDVLTVQVDRGGRGLGMFLGRETGFDEVSVTCRGRAL